MFQEIISSLEKNESLVYISIVEKYGSSPRNAGARMLIKESGEIFGTIGGGILEATAQNAAQECFMKQEPILYTFDLSSEDAANSDMICGGELKIYLYYLKPANLLLFKKAKSLLENNQSIFILFPKKVSHNLEILDISLDQVQQNDYLLEEWISPKKLYILGAGHVGRALATVAQFVGYQTVIIDDRADFAKDIVNKICPNFTNVFASENVRAEDYIAIVTRGHLYDTTVLEQALQTKANYIGMIGSKRKRDLVYQELEKKGVEPKRLAQVHSPIGLDIKSETPQEIAISIMAQILNF